MSTSTTRRALVLGATALLFQGCILVTRDARDSGPPPPPRDGGPPPDAPRPDTGPPPTGTQDTYESCGASADCRRLADVCFGFSSSGATRSACTHSCAVDTDCELGGRCLSFDGGASFVCTEACTSSATCEPDWSCQSLGDGRSDVCLPGAAPPALQPFDECPFGTAPDPCTSGVMCWGITVDGVMAGLCTRECTSNASCPLDPRGFAGSCLAFPGAPALCYEGCATAADCAPGWACKSMADGLTFPPICVPI